MEYSLCNSDGKSRSRKTPRRVPVLAALPALLIALGLPAGAYAADEAPPSGQ